MDAVLGYRPRVNNPINADYGIFKTGQPNGFSHTDLGGAAPRVLQDLDMMRPRYGITRRLFDNV